MPAPRTNAIVDRPARGRPADRLRGRRARRRARSRTTRPPRWPPALASGDFGRRRRSPTRRADEVDARVRRRHRGHGRGRARRSRSSTSRSPARPPRCRWAGPGRSDGASEWTAYQSEAALRLVDDEWQAEWKPALVEPSLKRDEVLDSSDDRPRPWADPRRGRAVALVADRPVVRFGIDRTQVKPARAGESARQLAQLVGVDAAPYVKQVEARRGGGLRRGDRVPPGRGARRPSRRGYDRHHGRAGRRGHPAAGADARVRGPDPRHRRRGHRGDDRGRPGEVPARRRGRAVRPPGAVRRPAARHPRRRRPGGRPRRLPSASCSRRSPRPGSRCD